MVDTDDEIGALENLPEDQEYKCRTKYEEILQKYYNKKTHISEPYRVQNGTVPTNILEFNHSFSYDCQKYFNLCIADPNTVIFASGNLIHFLNVATKEIQFLRGSTGGGIGHITKNPKFNHIAVAENGIDPPITIYSWPSMEVITCLFGGTRKQYFHLKYSPDGSLLASQGGNPDYSITIWNWQKSKILLQCKSHSHNVYNLIFSIFISGNLISCGSGHIKFWKMAETFTGLKLKGDLGRFGKTEISDIIGVYQMPDKKVISGCEWGNILLWDEDLVKFEISKKNKQFCHAGPIVQFEYINGELFSVGMDGFIRVWFYETIDQANPSEDNPFLEIQPIYEFSIAENESKDFKRNAMLLSIQKQEPDDLESTLWYAQDGNGGIWLIDLNTFTTPEVPQKILTCHAGAISDMDIAEWGPFIATLGIDGHLHIYNYMEKKLILTYHFHDIGRQVVWLPCKIDATGCTLVCAFGSGIIRVVIVAVLIANECNNIKGNFTRLIQVLKPHSQSINVISVNPSCSLLVTGSDDSSIFAFNICTTQTYPTLIPIGYIKLPSGISCMTWKPEHEFTLLIGCIKGDWAEVQLSNSLNLYGRNSYELIHCKPALFKFHSVKSAIRREIIKNNIEREKLKKIAQKREEMERLKAANPGIEIDEEAFLMDSQDDPPLPEIYIPTIPNKILMIQYTSQGTIWLSMAGFDAGYMYEYPIPEKNKIIGLEPVKCSMICDADDIEIRSCLLYKEGKYLFFGMEHGEIRVCRINPKDHTDLSDYWILPMHDNYNGYIPKMLLNYNRTMFFTCGHDGNLFSYIINDDADDEIINIPQPIAPIRSLDDVHDIEDIDESEYPTLEDVIVKAEHDRIAMQAKEKKAKTLELLHKLTENYSIILNRNASLLESQQIPHENFELDPRITADLNEQLETEMNLVHKKEAFQVEKSKLGLKKLMDHFIEPITRVPFAVCRILKPDTMICTIREQKLNSTFDKTYAQVVNSLGGSKKSVIEMKEKFVSEDIEKREDQSVKGEESFMTNLNLTSVQGELGMQINHMLQKYKARKARLEERQKEWNLMSTKRMDPNISYPDDIAVIELAEQMIGIYNLKDSPQVAIQSEMQNSTMIKYKQYLDCRKQLHYLRENFNKKLNEVRTDKHALYSEILHLIDILKKIHTEIPQKDIKPIPDLPIINNSIEFPDENLQFERYISIAEQAREAKYHRESIFVDEVTDSMDEEYEVLLLENKIKHINEKSSLFNILNVSEKKIQTNSIFGPQTSRSLYSPNHIDTAWEREMKYSRILRKIYDQDCILRYINNSCKEFDKRLDELEQERLNVVAESVYTELYLLTLHQEFIIIRDYEAKETLLRKNVDKKLMEQTTVKQKVQITNNKIENKKRNINKLQEAIKDITYDYMTSIKDNKFQEFLRKIYKKKFKLPKQNDESETSSTTESETSSEEDERGSIDSKDVGYIYFDENICPIGCDKELYSTAFIMRNKRYEHEHEIKENQKGIDKLYKEIELDTKQLKVIADVLKMNVDKLEKFMLEKQSKLNNIDVTIILNFQQLQHFINFYTVSSIQESIIFDKTKLSRLHVRVGELHEETSDLYARQKTNKMHLHRMKIDCKYMNNEINDFKNEIKEEMRKKFGQKISLTTMYETVLRRMVYNIKTDLTEMMKLHERQLKCIKKKYRIAVGILGKLIQDNTEKLSFLTILEEEQLSLRKVLRQVPISETEMLQGQLQYKADIMKLNTILTSQKKQKELFLTDIKHLSMKLGALPPIYHKSDNKRICKEYEHNSRLNNLMMDTVNSNIAGTTVPPLNLEESNLTSLVHCLVSRVIESLFGTKQVEQLKQDKFENIIRSFASIRNMKEANANIERVIKYIDISFPINEKHTIEIVHEAIRESLYDIIERKINLDGNVSHLVEHDKGNTEEQSQ